MAEQAKEETAAQVVAQAKPAKRKYTRRAKKGKPGRPKGSGKGKPGRPKGSKNKVAVAVGAKRGPGRPKGSGKGQRKPGRPPPREAGGRASQDGPRAPQRCP